METLISRKQSALCFYLVYSFWTLTSEHKCSQNTKYSNIKLEYSWGFSKNNINESEKTPVSYEVIQKTITTATITQHCVEAKNKQRTQQTYEDCLETVLSTPEEEAHELKLVPSVNEVVHFENDSYIVSCRASDTRLRWMDPDNVWIDNGRGGVHVEQRNNELVLVFTSISSKTDNGTWTCQSERGQQIAFNMIVYKPITFVDRPEIESVKENEEAVIKCMVTGDPSPTISWYYNGKPLNPDERKYSILADGLSINNVLKNDSGEYTCKAFQISAASSNVKEQTIRLNVQNKPIPPIHRESIEVQYGYLKGFVNLTCEAEAQPPATFKWYRNNKHLHSRHYQIINGEHISIVQLYLNNTKLFGDYVCEANNSLGTLRRTITLLNGTKPPAPPHITLRGVNSKTFDLDVGAQRSGETDPMDVLGYRFEILSKDDHRNNGGKWTNARVVLKDFTDGVTYLVSDLSPNTTYLIRVASRNPAGLSDWMGPKEFRTHTKATFSDASHSVSWNVPIHLIFLLVIYFAYDLFSPNTWNLIPFLD